MENRQKPARDNLKRDVTLPGIHSYMLLLTFRKLVWEMRGNCDGKLESKGGPQPQTRAYLEKICPQAKRLMFQYEKDFQPKRAYYRELLTNKRTVDCLSERP